MTLNCEGSILNILQQEVVREVGEDVHRTDKH